MKTITLTIENKSVSFNEVESKVLIALYVQALDSTGGEFGYALDADREGLSKNQFAGYLSALKGKDVFEYLDTDYSTTYGGQFAFTEEIKDQIEKIYTEK